jgi:hypothetical protein
MSAADMDNWMAGTTDLLTERLNTATMHSDAALEALEAGDLPGARYRFRLAAEQEADAAAMVLMQPERATLHRSAAQLALDAGDPTEAARLAAAGLAGPGTPPGLEAELRAIATEAARLLTPTEPTP